MRVKIEETCFIIEVHVLILARGDMVLGMQWLHQLGKVHWDFPKLLMHFSVEGKVVKL